MPAGSFDFDPYDMALAIDAIPIGVFLYQAGSGGDDGPYTLLPNIRCEQIQYKEGTDPPTARFSYILDERALALDWPTQFEQIWPLASVDPNYVVALDDELVVLATMPDDSTRVLFHGYSRVPQTDVSPATQHVNFVAVGVAIRCWDFPIGGRTQRDGEDPQNGNAVVTDLPTRFNPAGTGTRSVGGILKNCTPDGYDEDMGGNLPHPIFLDENLDQSPDQRTLWNLSKAVRYILAIWNTGTDANGDLIVANPDFGVLDSLLQNRRPVDGSEFYDPDDPSTYTVDPNVIRDFDATNKPWPEVVAQLLGFYGFGMRWVCEDDGEGNPYNYLEVYRKDQAGPTDPKPVYLPPAGTNLTGAIVNLSNLHAGFDFHGVANDIFIETHLERYEVSVILAPGFQPNPSDNTVANRVQFRTSNVATATATAAQRKAYRYYIADECGEGHWSLADSAWATGLIDFSAIFSPGDDDDEDDPPPSYVNRYRPGRNTLFSKDPLNRPYKAQLALSRDYEGAAPPCLWDSVSGTWQTIGDGTWDLLKDRLGIQVTVDQPEEWKIGPPVAGTAAQEPTGILRGITSLSNPSMTVQSEKQFWLRLTTVIEGDFGIGTEAERRDASPLANTIQRRVDATDHFHYDVVDGSSVYSPNPGPPGPDNATVVQDDTDNALAHACQLRSAHEFPPLTAALTIPQLVTYLQIGDRINEINGRDVSLLVNAGAEQGEAPSYPYVVALTWDLQGDKQATTVQLSDRRAEPRRPVA